MRRMTPEEALEYHSRGRKGKIEVVSVQALPDAGGPLARLQPRRRRAVPRDREGPGQGLRVHDQGQPRRRDLQRDGGARPRQHRPARVQARHGGQGRPLQAVRRHRRLRHRGGRRRPSTTFVETVARIAPTFGGINLEDVKSPECFEIEDAAEEAPEDPGLPRRPARHGDHLGRGVPERARGRRQEDRKREGRLLRRGRLGDRVRASSTSSYGVRPENLRMVDKSGVIYLGRDEGHEPLQGAVRGRDASSARSRTR